MFDGIVISGIDKVIYVDREEYPERVTSFAHDLACCELICKLSGEVMMHFGGKSYRLTQGTVYILPKGEWGNYSVERIAHGDCIDIFFESDSIFTDGVYITHIGENKKIESLFKRIFAIWIGKAAGYEYECMSLIYRIFSELKANNYVSSTKRDIIKPAVNFISENFPSSDINLDNLAQMCGISYSYFKRIFTEEFGLSPKKYILRLKINYASELLSEGIYSVSKVAEMSGFTDIYYFSRIFKKQTGITPTEYISKYRSSK